jgi:hypothetical protein
MIVIFDIDGTLANAEHRLHWIQTQPKNWRAFNAGIPDDPPIESVCQLARTLYKSGSTVLFCTGRSIEVKDLTVAWLDRHDIRGSTLYMRSRGDHRPDFEVKEELLKRIVRDHGQPDLVFEDRQQVVDMWRRNGIRCLQVAAGQY